MRQGRLIATGAMLVFCAFAMWQSLLLSLTDRLGPGPGFFPFWLGLIGTVLALALLVTTFREAADPADADTHVLPDGAGATRDNVRKAYVTLKEGQELNLSGESA